MSRRIPLDLNSSHEIAIDGALVAQALELDVAAFRQLMDDRKITVLCERGTGEDAGLYRATFYHDRRRARLVIDREGRIVGQVDKQRAHDGRRAGSSPPSSC